MRFPWQKREPANPFRCCARMHWTIVGVQHMQGTGIPTILADSPGAHTVVLRRCDACGGVQTVTLLGTWTAAQLSGVTAAESVEDLLK